MKCWWEDDIATTTVFMVQQAIAASVGSKRAYRADRGVVDVPSRADLRDFCDLAIALDARVDAGRAYLAANPDQTRYRRIVRLLELDADATRGWFEKLLADYERTCDGLAQVKGSTDDDDELSTGEHVCLDASGAGQRCRLPGVPRAPGSSDGLGRRHAATRPR